MSLEMKKNLWHALFVGLLSGIVIGIYAALPIEAPLYWAAFITLPTVFMFGGETKQIMPLSLNALFGLFIGWLCFQMVGGLVSFVEMPLAFAVATALCTVLLQGTTGGLLSSSFGRCPMAFVGMITCFAAGGSNLLVAAISLLVGVCAATLMAQTGKLAAKLAGTETEAH